MVMFGKLYVQRSFRRPLSVVPQEEASVRVWLPSAMLGARRYSVGGWCVPRPTQHQRVRR